MKRKQIYIGAEQEEQLRDLARERHVSEAAIIRDALKEYIDRYGYKGFKRMEDNPLWGLVGLATSADDDAPTDGSINHDHYLYGAPKKYRFAEDGSIERIPRPE